MKREEVAVAGIKKPRAQHQPQPPLGQTQDGKKKFLTPESTGVRKKFSWYNGTGAILYKSVTTCLPRCYLYHQYPMVQAHEDAVPFPVSDLLGNCFKLLKLYAVIC